MSSKARLNIMEATLEDVPTNITKGKHETYKDKTHKCHQQVNKKESETDHNFTKIPCDKTKSTDMCKQPKK